MRYLLDTHVILFALLEPHRLSQIVRAILEDRTIELHVSAASAWEIATKHRLGKLPLAGQVAPEIEHHLRRMGCTELPITVAHARLAGAINSRHRDPFDRLIAAQAILEGLPLLGNDSAFPGLGVQPIW
jgi:PIN domain nuclease of toxin-antitoxin system